MLLLDLDFLQFSYLLLRSSFFFVLNAHLLHDHSHHVHDIYHLVFSVVIAAKDNYTTTSWVSLANHACRHRALNDDSLVGLPFVIVCHLNLRTSENMSKRVERRFFLESIKVKWIHGYLLRRSGRHVRNKLSNFRNHRSFLHFFNK